MSSITPKFAILKIWREPSKTFETILSDTEDPYIDSKVMPFVALAGIGSGLDRAALRSMGDDIQSLPLIIAVASFAGIIGAFIGLYLYSWVFSHTNKWLGGTGDFERIKTALAWGTIPFVFAALFWIPNIIFFKMDNFTDVTPLLDSNPTLLYSYLALALIEFIFVIYCCVIWLKGLGRACNFSAWKALGTVTISALIIIIPIVLVVVLIVAFL